MAKPKPSYTAKQLEDIERYAGCGATCKQIAYLMNVSFGTFMEHTRFVPEVTEALEKGRAKAHAQVMATAFDMATSGECPAMTIFWLKTRCQWREVKEPLPDDQKEVDRIKSLPTSELIKLVKDKVG